MERRRHVRVGPLPELPAAVEALGLDADIRLQVLDISVSGLGLWIQRGRLPKTAGELLQLRLTLGDRTAEVEAIIRHVSADGSHHGVELQQLSDEARSVVHRYVAELSERGAGS